jgi:hypothetical protein
MSYSYHLFYNFKRRGISLRLRVIFQHTVEVKQRSDLILKLGQLSTIHLFDRPVMEGLVELHDVRRCDSELLP